ncbi:LysR family transcriptional regulator [Marinomonas piezotolerans]|uniref:LysR family transcriptional regulator n=1 Tax=Marinomonas piezotolerans TaxID=2213058 RepID=A0A370U9P0_9GAMM|nr:transcriptional regulator GcvA [Marinomonas piezotolerans]RDL44499.1 LysR family transcriptional regulator [Marinomonas piezotolerans]
MKKKLPPLNWLRSFEVSARYLNFTQAAQELNMTQAAVSQQIKGLEAQLGTQLFKRLPRGLELTKSGRAYVPIVHESIERLAEVTDELFGQGQTRPLTIRSSLIFFTTWLAPRLGRFRKAHPEVNLRLPTNIWAENLDRESDMEIRYGMGDWPGMQCDRLTWDYLIPVCSPSLLSTPVPLITPNQLANYTLLHVDGYNEGWAYWLNKTGFQHIDSSQGIHFDTLISAFEMAKSGEGIALGRSSLIKEMTSTGQLVAPFEQKLPTSEAFYLLSSNKGFDHPHAELFRAWILEEVEQAKSHWAH